MRRWVSNKSLASPPISSCLLTCYPARDDADAIDQNNVIGGGRTRGAKPTGGYAEPGDEEGLPTDDGTSRPGVTGAV